MLEHSASNDSITDDTLKNIRELIKERCLTARAIKQNPNAVALIDRYEYINLTIKSLLNID